MYRPPATPPRSKWAQFLHQMRRERDWNQTQGFEALHEGLRLGAKSRAFYIALDKGDRQPKPHEIKYLVAFFGREPEDLAAAEPQPDFAAALTALAVELKAAREERARYLAMEATVEALRQTVAGLLRSSRTAEGSGASRGRRALGSSAG